MRRRRCCRRSDASGERSGAAPRLTAAAGAAEAAGVAFARPGAAEAAGSGARASAAGAAEAAGAALAHGSNQPITPWIQRVFPLKFHLSGHRKALRDPLRALLQLLAKPPRYPARCRCPPFGIRTGSDRAGDGHTKEMLLLPEKKFRIVIIILGPRRDLHEQAVELGFDPAAE